MIPREIFVPTAVNIVVSLQLAKDYEPSTASLLYRGLAKNIHGNNQLKDGDYNEKDKKLDALRLYAYDFDCIV